LYHESLKYGVAPLQAHGHFQDDVSDDSIVLGKRAAPERESLVDGSFGCLSPVYLFTYLYHSQPKEEHIRAYLEKFKDLPEV
jgi:hypothetical protein